MLRPCLLLGLLLGAPLLPAAGPIAVGLTAAGHPIQAAASGSGSTVVVVCTAPCRIDGRGFRVLTVSPASPDRAPLAFPPVGRAYRDNPESHYLWRWIGVTAPDLVVVPDDEELARALANNAVAGIGRIPVRRAMPRPGEALPPSEAHREIERRLRRSPHELAIELAQTYGHEFPQAVYIPAMALIARLRLGTVADVEELAEPYVDGARDSLAKATPSHLAGHLVFGELAERTHKRQYVDLVRRAADLAARDTAIYNEMSDGVFMGCPILAKAGKLTGDTKYFDLALRQLQYMQKLCLRGDGLYRHSPLNETAWGRGNAFPALGLALALSDMPPRHPAFAPMRQAFQRHLAALARFQNEEGMWREVIDLPGAFSEFSATAMIATAMLRGIRRGWLERAEYQPRVERAWRAILRRAAPDGTLIDVCESTGKQKSLQDYLNRAAILGIDARGGGMALLFATEMMQ